MASKGFEEARRRCVEVARKGGEHLDLSDLGLTDLPREILACAHVRSLDLYTNSLTTIPPEITGFTRLERLDVSHNPIRKLPDGIDRLRSLKRLDIEFTRISALPRTLRDLPELVQLRVGSEELRDITVVQELEALRALWCVALAPGHALPDLEALQSLTRLHLSGITLEEIPPWVGRLRRLVVLELPANGLREVSPAIAALDNLEGLNLSHNPIDDLPVEMGALSRLLVLGVEGCPLTRLPPEIVEQGSDAVLAYLRDQAQSGTRQWVSKLLVVGQGGVGKTSLLRALRGETFQKDEATTHGIDVRPLQIPHPTEKDVTMDLSAWDFGGQEIYHATHQFFLTNRSLFLLVWNARHGHEQGRLYYWLDTIRARAPASPILLVATHVDERSADLPLSDIRQRYPQVVDQYIVSNKTADGIETLRQAIRAEAAKLPLMGERWPKTWLAAAQAVRARAQADTHITPQKLWATMKQSGVAEDRHKILATWQHELGDILFFQDNPALDDIVLLDPQWATKAISRVLECEAVIEQRGIFTRAQMNEIWSDVEPYLRDHLLRLMEQFDLSYRTVDDRDVSIVVERLSHDVPAEMSSRFDALLARPGQREITMRFQLEGTLPAGIPTWFIAREHRFTTRTHYRQGALFADESKEHLALIQAFPERRHVNLTVRGPLPHAFFTLLRDGLELTLSRFPGLKVTRYMPCPGHEGEPCPEEFKFEQLEKCLKREPPVETMQCRDALVDVNVREMLFGLSTTTQGDVLRAIEEMREAQKEQTTELRALTEIMQRGFAEAIQIEQRREETHCPSLFVLRPGEGGAWKKKLFGQSVEMHLVCEAPGQAHLAGESGRYKTKFAPQWLRDIAPYMEKVVFLLKGAAPLLGPVVGLVAEGSEKMFAGDIKLMQELVKKLPEIEEEDDSLSLRHRHGEESLERVGGATLRIVRSLLDDLDPRRAWGGLGKVHTPEGQFLWLCEGHAAMVRG